MSGRLRQREIRVDPDGPKIAHVSLDGAFTGIHSPSLRFEANAAFSGARLHVRVLATLEGAALLIVHSHGIHVDPDGQGFTIGKDDEGRVGPFGFTLSPAPGGRRGLAEPPAPPTGGRRRAPHWTALSRLGRRAAPFGGVVRRLGTSFPFVANELVLHVTSRGEPLVAAMQLTLPRGAIAFSERTHGLVDTYVEGGSADTPRFSGVVGDGKAPLRLHLRYRPFTALRLMTAPVLILTTALLLDFALALERLDALDAADQAGWRADPLVVLGVLVVNVGAFFSLARLPGGSTTRSLLGTLRVAGWAFLVVLTVAFRQRLPLDEGLLTWGLDVVLVGFCAIALWAGAVAALIYPYAWEREAREGWIGALLVLSVAGVVLVAVAKGAGLLPAMDLAQNLARLLAT